MVAGWTLCMGSQSTCWSPTDPSPPTLLTCQYINLLYGSCSAMMGGTHRLHPAAWAKHVVRKECFPLPTTRCSPPWHPESCQEPHCYMRVSGWRLGKGDVQEGAEAGPGCGQGMGLWEKSWIWLTAPFAALARSLTWRGQSLWGSPESNWHRVLMILVRKN